jgi:hypothetical protein
MHLTFTAFAGKINGKRKNTLGLFVSIDGFSAECLQTTSSDLRCLILMDGMDLNAILTDRIRWMICSIEKDVMLPRLVTSV